MFSVTKQKLTLCLRVLNVATLALRVQLVTKSKILLNQDSSGALDDVCAICLVRTFFYSKKQKIKQNRETLNSSAALDDVCTICRILSPNHFFSIIHFLLALIPVVGGVCMSCTEIFMHFGNSTFGMWALVFFLCKFCANLAACHALIKTSV